jgi:hypothetical protein
MTRQRRAPLRKVVDRLVFPESGLRVETLECGHERRFHRFADRRGVQRWYDGKGRIVSPTARVEKRGCDRCVDPRGGE